MAGKVATLILLLSAISSEDKYIIDPTTLQKIEDAAVQQLGNAVRAADAGNDVVNNFSIEMENLFVGEAEKELEGCCFDYCCYAADPREQPGGGFKCASCGRKLKQITSKAINFKFEP